jgi:ankyrin repeat protein
MMPSVPEQSTQLIVGTKPAVSAHVTDLLRYARHGRYAECEHLLKIGVPVDSQDAHGNTLLTIACQNGNKRIAKLALRMGANMDHQNKKGNTPLHYAFAFNYSELGQYLISKGAKDGIVNEYGLNCFQGLNPEKLAGQPSAREVKGANLPSSTSLIVTNASSSSNSQFVLNTPVRSAKSNNSNSNMNSLTSPSSQSQSQLHMASPGSVSFQLNSPSTTITTQTQQKPGLSHNPSPRQSSISESPRTSSQMHSQLPPVKHVAIRLPIGDPVPVSSLQNEFKKESKRVIV